MAIKDIVPLLEELFKQSGNRDKDFMKETMALILHKLMDTEVSVVDTSALTVWLKSTVLRITSCLPLQYCINNCVAGNWSREKPRDKMSGSRGILRYARRLDKFVLEIKLLVSGLT